MELEQFSTVGSPDQVILVTASYFDKEVVGYAKKETNRGGVGVIDGTRADGKSPGRPQTRLQDQG